MRWQEEVILTSYEMQWVVRYFRYKSNNWSRSVEDWAGQTGESADERGSSPGVLAYAKRKEWTWLQVSLKADQVFKVINNAYKSPL